MDDSNGESYGDGSDNVTIPDPVGSDLWIVQWDAGSDKEFFSHSNSIELRTSNENSDIELIMHYDSENDSVVPSSTNSSHDEEIPTLYYRGASAKSDVSEDSLDMTGWRNM